MKALAIVICLLFAGSVLADHCDDVYNMQISRIRWAIQNDPQFTLPDFIHLTIEAQTQLEACRRETAALDDLQWYLRTHP